MPKAPDLVQLDPAALEKAAVAADTKGYAWSDADYARRFPNLVNARNYAVNNSVSNLGGVQDPSINSALNQSGIGPVNLGNEFQQSRNLGQPVLAKEQRDRTYFQRLLSENPERTFGLNGGDVARIAAANAGSKMSFDWANFGSKVNAANAKNASSAAGIQALTGGIASAAKSLGSFFQPKTTTTSDPYLNVNQYATGGTYGNYYNAPNLTYNGPGAYEGDIGGVPVSAASPVEGYNYDTGATASSGGGF